MLDRCQGDLVAEPGQGLLVAGGDVSGPPQALMTKSPMPVVFKVTTELPRRVVSDEAVSTISQSRTACLAPACLA